MTEWKRVIKLGGWHFGLTYWRFPAYYRRSVNIMLFGRLFHAEWEWV
jgi:hypothetical protein